MKIKHISILLVLFMLTNCAPISNNSEIKNRIQYNLIQPENGIYVITEKNVEEAVTKNLNFEKIYYE
ncbi:MAG: hypothetical protein OQJ81_12105, partial [Melioribacteraceae bacterium]|nr:hypothetical protein [Melioribacteraceae bacterium]